MTMKNDNLRVDRVAIPVVSDKGASSRVNPHFGKSKGFVVVNSDGSDLVYLKSDDIRALNECAPITGLAASGAGALLCVGMGRGARARCDAAGLRVFQAEGATVQDALSPFAAGLSVDFPESSICDHGHDHDHEHACEEGHCH